MASTANGYGISFRSNKNVQKLDSVSNIYTIDRQFVIYEYSKNHGIKSFKKVNFMLCECNKKSDCIFYDLLLKLLSLTPLSSHCSISTQAERKFQVVPSFSASGKVKPLT